LAIASATNAVWRAALNGSHRRPLEFREILYAPLLPMQFGDRQMASPNEPRAESSCAPNTVSPFSERPVRETGTNTAPVLHTRQARLSGLVKTLLGKLRDSFCEELGRRLFGLCCFVKVLFFPLRGQIRALQNKFPRRFSNLNSEHSRQTHRI
jgi:hypothetical protein